MIKTRAELKEILCYEKELNFGRFGRYQCLLAIIKDHPRYINWKYLKLLRIAGYYYTSRKKSFVHSLLYFWYCRRKNRLGRKLGIELNEKSFEKGLELFHTFGTVVNGDSIIGENCKLHGNNCIGNDGHTPGCPKIGDNVRIGVGAKVIGDVTLADNITVAAGAVVVHSFTTPGVTIAGVPAKVVAHKKNNETL